MRVTEMLKAQRRPDTLRSQKFKRVRRVLPRGEILSLDSSVSAVLIRRKDYFNACIYPISGIHDSRATDLARQLSRFCEISVAKA